MIAVAVSTKPVFTAEKPKVLFRIEEGSLSRYDVHSDDQHFVITRLSKRPTKIILVTNWFEELKRKFSTDD
jgi:hypothetical protein